MFCCRFYWQDLSTGRITFLSISAEIDSMLVYQATNAIKENTIFTSS